jgi:hypothetical protein
MPSNRNVFFGSPPFRFLADHLAQNEEFIGQSRQILDLGDDAFRRLVARLSSSDRFLDRTALRKLFDEALGKGKGTHDLAAVIHKIAGLLHDADKPAGEAMDDLAEAIQEKAVGLETQERVILIERLRLLAAEPIGLAKQYKARALVGAIGSELDEFKFICDIRPIFDERREKIEGAIPITILRLAYTLPDQGDAVVELRITEKQLKEFKVQVETAQRKLDIIKDSLRDQGVPIPITRSTVREEE